MRKDVRELLHKGYYNDKTFEEFKSDAIVWAGEPLRPEDEARMRTLTDDAALNGESRDEILDRLCDYAHAVMLL